MPQPLIRTILIDDEQHVLDTLESLLKHYPDIQIIQKISDPEQAVKTISNDQPDLLFLDIHMPKMDGFQLLEAIRPFNIHPNVIFITSYDDYAIKAIRYAAFDFLMKPIELAELGSAIDRLRQDIKNNHKEQTEKLLGKWHAHQKLKFNTQRGMIFIHPDHILYIEAQANYSCIFIEESQYEVISMNIGTLEKQLPNPPFMRVSRSCIINTIYIYKIHRKDKYCELVKKNKSYQIAISRNKIKKLEELA